jgi:hypothetical protein
MKCPLGGVTELLRDRLQACSLLSCMEEAYRRSGRDTTLCPRHLPLSNIAVAQTEAKIQPDAMADDLRREPMAVVQVGYSGVFIG